MFMADEKAFLFINAFAIFCDILVAAFVVGRWQSIGYTFVCKCDILKWN